MSEQYYCPICANKFPKPGAEYLGSTENNCLGCLHTLEQAEQLLRPVVADGVSKPTHNMIGSSHLSCAVLTCTDAASQRCRTKLLPRSSNSTARWKPSTSVSAPSTSKARLVQLTPPTTVALHLKVGIPPSLNMTADTTSQIPRATRNPTSIQTYRLQSSSTLVHRRICCSRSLSPHSTSTAPVRSPRLVCTVHITRTPASLTCSQTTTR